MKKALTFCLKTYLLRHCPRLWRHNVDHSARLGSNDSKRKSNASMVWSDPSVSKGGAGSGWKANIILHEIEHNQDTGASLRNTKHFRRNHGALFLTGKTLCQQSTRLWRYTRRKNRECATWPHSTAPVKTDNFKHPDVMVIIWGLSGTRNIDRS